MVAVGAALATLYTVSSTQAQATPLALPDTSIEKALTYRGVFVETHVSIVWSDQKPVVGAKVFHHYGNQLLGVTDTAGYLLLTVPNGTVIRMVDPTYGQQQALHIVQAQKKSNRQMLSTTSTSPYIDAVATWWEHY